MGTYNILDFLYCPMEKIFSAFLTAGIMVSFLPVPKYRPFLSCVIESRHLPAIYSGSVSSSTLRRNEINIGIQYLGGDAHTRIKVGSLLIRRRLHEVGVTFAFVTLIRVLLVSIFI